MTKYVTISGNGNPLPRLITQGEMAKIEHAAAVLAFPNLAVAILHFKVASPEEVIKYNELQRENLINSVSEHALKTGEFDPPPEVIFEFSRNINEMEYQLIQDATNSIGFSTRLGPIQ